MNQFRRTFASGLAALVFAAVALRAADAPSDSFSIDDYFRLKRITQVELSPDGRIVAYVVHAGAVLDYYSDKLPPEEKRSVRTVYLQPVAGGPARALDAIADAQELTFVPGSGELAFLTARDGATQVYTFDPASGALRRKTEGSDDVESFRFSPDGRSLAFVTRAATPPSEGLYQQFLHGDTGIVIDSDTLSLYDFVDPENNSARRPRPPVLRLAVAGAAAFTVPVPGEPESGASGYHWSPDSRSLSVTFTPADNRAALAGKPRTSVGIFDVSSRSFRTLVAGEAPTGGRPSTRYLGGEWVPGTRSVFLRRVTELDPWVSLNFPDCAIVDADRGPSGATWRTAEVYGGRSRFWIVDASRIYAENTLAGVQSMFTLTAAGTVPADVVAGVDGSATLARFSGDFATFVFVNESLTRPPELFVRRGRAPAQALTSLNIDVARRVRHTSREVRWTSADGATVRGWLLEPSGAGKGPFPMVTHVHGGPGFAYPNTFAPYFEIWPYPVEVMAARGTAVFIPNYRGTMSYGRSFALPSRLDREPVDDVVAGVKAMVAAGVADPTRLGITGHSHGAWLGPLVMTMEHVFKASSFAEGASNEVIQYSLMPADLNRQVHDFWHGVSFWDDPVPYLEGSPDMRFRGVKTASLWEGGAQSAAVMMMSYPKVARHFGAPTEFVIYPKTQHNPNLPSIQRESADRNLDWFAFWLDGTESPGKEEQYARWRKLRADQVATGEGP